MSETSESAVPINQLCAIVATLRGPHGCPWDREQTHRTLRGQLLEEAYETVEAIDRADDAHLAEELGDLLLHVVLHGQIAEEEGRFNFDRIAAGVAEKLVRRHPHVFADTVAADTDAVLKQWDEIKREEKGHTTESLLEGVSQALPALMRGQKIQKRAARVGFDWAEVGEVVAKVREETDEAVEALAAGDPAAIEEEIGDLLFSVVNLARKAGIDAEVAMEAATAKFTGRFQALEAVVAERGDRLQEMTLAEMDVIWNTLKTPKVPT